MMVLNIVFLNTYNTLIRKFSKVFEKKIFDIKFVSLPKYYYYTRIKHESQNRWNKMKTP